MPRARGSSGSSESSRRSASSRCSSLRLVGTMTLRITRWLPRRRLPSRGRPAPRRTSSWPGWVPARDLDLALALEGRHGDRGAEHRLGGRDRDDADQVGAVALEALVLGDRDLDVEVAGRRARARRRGRRRRPAAAGRLSIPAGISTACVLLAAVAAAAAALLAGRLGNLAGAAAGVAGDAADHLPERGARRPGAAGRRRRSARRCAIGVPGSAPLPWQCSQAPTASKRDLARGRRWRPPRARSRPRPGCRRPAARPPAAEAEGIAAAEEGLEDVVDRAEARRCAGRSRRSAGPRARRRRRCGAARRRRAPRRPRPPP